MQLPDLTDDYIDYLLDELVGYDHYSRRWRVRQLKRLLQLALFTLDDEGQPPV